MKKTILLILVIIASLVIIRSFFMPWARVSTSVVKVSRELTAATEKQLIKIPKLEKAIKELKKATDTMEALGDIEIKSSISGYDIPKMVNRRTSKVAISLMQVIFKDTKDLDKKSYAVYLLPLSAVICILLAMAGQKKKIPVVIMLALSGTVSLLGLYNLKTMDLSHLAVNIVIEKGLWYMLYGFLFIFFVDILWLALDKQ